MPTILVVDDDSANRLLVTTVLAYAGHTVLGAANGADGLRSAAEHLPDLILLDLSMPSMSGPEFVRALRADPRTASVEVALYTSTPMNAALRDFMEIYAVAHVVPKPSEPEELLRAVEVAVERRQSRIPGQSSP